VPAGATFDSRVLSYCVSRLPGEDFDRATRPIKTECHLSGAMAPRPLFGVAFLMWLPGHFQARMHRGCSCRTTRDNGR
jgi:hypothetical protein